MRGITLTDMGRHSPLWVAPFPRHGVVKNNSEEIELNRSKKVRRLASPALVRLKIIQSSRKKAGVK